MTFLDLFAGIGGMRRGMELARHECVGFVEYDKYAIASYTAMHLATDEQIECIKNLQPKDRKSEILKEEYRNGEWFHDDITTLSATDMPRADCWCFGAPCQSFSIAGRQEGFDGESGLVREVFRLLNETREEDRPEWLIYENVKGMLSSNRGLDFLAILSEIDRRGYDVEWQLLNSKYHGVPQNRERVYTIGHLRRCGSRKLFPIKGRSGENRTSIDIVGVIGDSERRRRNRGRIIGSDGTLPALTATMYKEVWKVAILVLTPDRVNKRQNGRRFKENGDVAFTLTAQDRHGVAISPNENNVDTIWYEKEQCDIAIRKLTPKECFRLQGWTDDYFERAELVNSNTQLYKQAGNGVTVNVMYDIAKNL